MTTGAWFHCFSGIAGDMALGSLIDAGADIDDVTQVLRALDVDAWELDVDYVTRSGIRSTHVNVTSNEEHVVRTYATIRTLIEQASVPDRVRARSLAVFEALANVEGRMHGQSPEHVHFHEVGGIDAIVDIVGTCAALESLGVDEIYASAVATGTGTIQSAHGMIPTPAPAVVGLLQNAPMYGTDQPFELVTPTGAAILSALATGFGPMPSFRSIRGTGFGAGTRDPHGMPNVTQVIIGELDEATTTADERVTLLETNVDDITGETLAYTIDQLLDAGALDAWITPIVMKKGRPAYTVSALANTSQVQTLTQVMTEQTGSFGVRGREVQRWTTSREIVEVEVEGQPIRVKVGPHRAKAEFEDAAIAAQKLGRPVREVIAGAEATWRQQSDS